MVIEQVTYEGIELALIVRGGQKANGISFLTNPDSELQVGSMMRESCYQIAPHVHKRVHRKICSTQEVLFVKRGFLRVDFYNDERVYLQSRLLRSGDVILLASGGHGFEFLEDSEIIEVKQGPYVGDSDKERFTPVSRSEICVQGKIGPDETS